MAFKPKSDIARVTKAALRGCRPDDRGLLLGNADSFDVAVSAACVERAVVIIDRLIGHLKEGGSAPTFERPDHRTKLLKLDGEAVRVKIVEELDRTRHVPTKEEQERLKERFPYPRVPAWDYQPTGRLTLTTDPAQYGRTETWSDRPEARLEDSLPRIAKSIRQLVVAQRTRRTEMEQKARLSAERDHARYGTEALNRKREELCRALVAEARRWQEASLLRDYAREVQVEAASVTDLAGSGALAEFVDGLLDASDTLDPLPARLAALVDSTLRSADDDQPADADGDFPPALETLDSDEPDLEGDLPDE